MPFKCRPQPESVLALIGCAAARARILVELLWSQRDWLHCLAVAFCVGTCTIANHPAADRRWITALTHGWIAVRHQGLERTAEKERRLDMRTAEGVVSNDARPLHHTRLFDLGSSRRLILKPCGPLGCSVLRARVRSGRQAAQPQHPLWWCRQRLHLCSDLGCTISLFRTLGRSDAAQESKGVSARERARSRST